MNDEPARRQAGAEIAENDLRQQNKVAANSANHTNYDNHKEHKEHEERQNKPLAV